MSRHLIFDSDGVSISSTVARFNDASYQISNIGSVRVLRLRTRRVLTVVLFLLGLLLLAAALFSGHFDMKAAGGAALRSGELAWSGAGLMVGAALLQLVWPGRKYVLVLKTTGGDVQAFVTRKRALMGRIKQAMEQAFIARSSRA